MIKDKQELKALLRDSRVRKESITAIYYIDSPDLIGDITSDEYILEKAIYVLEPSRSSKEYIIGDGVNVYSECKISASEDPTPLEASDIVALTGYVTGDSEPIVPEDSLLSALGKLEARINALAG